ncbi:SRPBCC family protein [Cohnella fermenti]|uniref:SRPBCC domain-containing protein n=1 Tax=Cohnella fermenti TaxID=2565925 RepID=A0A4S4C6F2_9BACL|nr:SRPBCC domain-containing protein [Cohnella fermenti]THF83471.1 SRPBCC domain-containing protein [Cohnella fermenti]
MTTSPSENNGVATRVEEKEFIMERIFNAPRELVFDAYTQPEHLKRWWAPLPYTVPTCRIDLRPGGVWHYSMRSPQGEEHWARSVYREIVRPERLVYTSTFADEHGNPTDDIPEQLNTVTFEPLDGKTKLTIRVGFDTAENLQLTLKMGMVEGMTMTMNHLGELFEKGEISA